MESEKERSQSPYKDIEEEETVALRGESSSYGHGCDLGDNYSSLMDYEDYLNDFLDVGEKDWDTQSWTLSLESPDSVDMDNKNTEIGTSLTESGHTSKTKVSRQKVPLMTVPFCSTSLNLGESQSSAKLCSFEIKGNLYRHETDKDGFLIPLPPPKEGYVSVEEKARVITAGPSTSSNNSQLKSNEAKLNLENFQAWIFEKANSNDVTLGLTSKVFGSRKTQDLLEQKISELRSDSLLMKNRTTKELYLILVTILKELLQEQWQRTERKYCLTSGFLEELN